MAAKKFSHHFVPHHHPESDEQHRAHALGSGALLGYLLLFIVTICGVYLIGATAPQILGSATYTAAQIVELTNIKRAQNGLAPLTANSMLASAASAKSQDMFANNYWAHFSPQGKSPWNFISAIGYKYIYAGENLARDFNSAQDVVNAWMASPTHRSNILDKNFKEIGVAVADGKLDGREGVLVVQMFGASVAQIASESTSDSSQLTVDSSQTENPEVPATATLELGESSLAQIEGPATTSIDSGSATVLASRQFSISKGISLLLVGFIFGLFALEVALVSKKSHLALKSSTLAHLGLLGLVLAAVWYAAAGAVI